MNPGTRGRPRQVKGETSGKALEVYQRTIEEAHAAALAEVKRLTDILGMYGINPDTGRLLADEELERIPPPTPEIENGPPDDEPVYGLTPDGGDVVRVGPLYLCDRHGDVPTASFQAASGRVGVVLSYDGDVARVWFSLDDLYLVVKPCYLQRVGYLSPAEMSTIISSRARDRWGSDIRIEDCEPPRKNKVGRKAKRVPPRNGDA